MPRYHLLSLQAAWAAPAYRESVNHFLQDSRQLAAVLRAGQPWCLVFSWGPVGSPVHPSLIRPHCRRDHTELGGDVRTLLCYLVLWWVHGWVRKRGSPAEREAGRLLHHHVLSSWRSSRMFT